ncbi:MAG: hypothetical protein IIZ67_03995 [Bacilli bacterium]|nr:hypothetical protein [Bacilli bacterium]
MKNEIKEILDFKEDADYKRLSVDEIVILKDYITNLQEENDYLKDIVSNTELSNEIKKADKWSKRELYKINYQRLKANQRLQEENERLREENERLIISLSAQEELTMNEYNKKQDYKSRNEKAIECINNDGSFDDHSEILNILKGSDK